MGTDKVRVGCDIPPKLRRSFDIECTHEGITMSDVLRVAIIAFMDGDRVNFGDTDDLRHWMEEYRVSVRDLWQDAAGEEG